MARRKGTKFDRALRDARDAEDAAIWEANSYAGHLGNLVSSAGEVAQKQAAATTAYNKLQIAGRRLGLGKLNMPG